MSNAAQTRIDRTRTREARAETIARRCARHAKRGTDYTRSGRRRPDAA